MSGFQGFLHHFVLAKSDTSSIMVNIFEMRAFFKKIFERDMLIWTKLTTFFHIFCEFLINFEVTFITIIGADDIWQGDFDP